MFNNKITNFQMGNFSSGTSNEEDFKKKYDSNALYRRGPATLYKYTDDNMLLTGYTGSYGSVFMSDIADYDIQGFLFRNEDRNFVEAFLQVDKNLSKREINRIPDSLKIEKQELKDRFSIEKGSAIVSVPINSRSAPTKKEVSDLKNLYTKGRRAPILEVIYSKKSKNSNISWIGGEFVQVRFPSNKDLAEKTVNDLNALIKADSDSSEIKQVPEEFSKTLLEMFNASTDVKVEMLSKNEFAVYEPTEEFGAYASYKRSDISKIAQASISDIYWTLALFEVNYMKVFFKDEEYEEDSDKDFD